MMNSKILKSAIQISLSHFAILLLCVNCTQPRQRVEENGITTIDVIGNISNTHKVNLSSIASSIEYCMLESNEQCFIAGEHIYSSGDCFVAMDRDRCYVFERKTGKFVRQISQIGQGPNDYQNTATVLECDNGQICLMGNNQLLFFNLDGSLSHKTKHFANFFKSYKDLYVCYFSNGSGDLTIRIAFYDNKTGERIDTIPNYRFFKREKGRPYSSGNDFSLYQFNNGLYCKDIYCDTLYQIDNFSLEPRYIFNTGGRAVPYEKQIEGRTDYQAQMAGREYDRYAKYIVIQRIMEDAYFLYFTIENRNSMYPVIYNKFQEKIHIMPPHPTPFSLGDGKPPLFGFENDLDGGLPFWPQQMISDKEMMCVYSVEKLMELDSSKISDEKLKNVLHHLEENSNPIVAIVTLKD